MAPPLPLDRLQRWMQAVIVHPGDAASAPRAALARGEAPGACVADLVRPSARLTAAERVGIYHGMYLLRMEEALAADYPALRHLLGARGFRDLVRGYVRAYPSRHFSLNRLGDHLPEYVARDARLKRRAFCHDLARLERALALAFDAPQTPPLGADAVAAVPGERWEGARLVPVAAFALLAFRYPVGAYADSVRDDEGHEHPPLRRADTWAVVYRRDYSVWRRDLSRAGYHVLRELASGRTVGEAVASALRIRARDRPTESGLFRLFRGWMAAGLFQGIEL